MVLRRFGQPRRRIAGNAAPDQVVVRHFHRGAGQSRPRPAVDRRTYTRETEQGQRRSAPDVAGARQPGTDRLAASAQVAACRSVAVLAANPPLPVSKLDTEAVTIVSTRQLSTPQ